MPTPHVDANEILYRQIGPGGNPIYFDPTRTPAIHQSRFLPTSRDADGLSLIRSRFRTEIWSAYRVEQPTVRFRLAILRSIRLQQLAEKLGIQAMTYAPSADSLDDKFGEPWAHCVIVEINRNEYDNNSDTKKLIKEWALGVANLVTKADVIGPFLEPTDLNPYRPANAQA